MTSSSSSSPILENVLSSCMPFTSTILHGPRAKASKASSLPLMTAGRLFRASNSCLSGRAAMSRHASQNSRMAGRCSANQPLSLGTWVTTNSRPAHSLSGRYWTKCVTSCARTRIRHRPSAMLRRGTRDAAEDIRLAAHMTLCALIADAFNESVHPDNLALRSVMKAGSLAAAIYIVRIAQALVKIVAHTRPK